MSTISFDDIKTSLLKLALEHQNVDDFDAEIIEKEAEEHIVSYCEGQGYLINGFPTEKKQLSEEELEEDYFSRERYQLYLDTLAIEKDDVASLMWEYVSAFWPGQFERKEEYLESIRGNLESGVFYDVSL
ncbi:MAG: hypothetical protein ACO3BD_06485 [Chitinophagaceae bacterium]